METIYTIAYTITILGVLISLVLLLLEVIQIFKWLTRKKEDFSKMSKGIDAMKKDAEYIKEVKDKTFLDELLLLRSIVKDFNKFSKKDVHKKDALVETVKKDIQKDALTQLRNKIKAL